MSYEYYKKRFEEASDTGRKVLILKADGTCDCFNPNDLTNSEPNPKCNECFGTGKFRTMIRTEKIRYELNVETYKEYLGLTRETFDVYSFFFPEYYGHLTNADIIVTFDEKEVAIAAFEIVNIEKFVKDKFVYYEVFGRKITYLDLELMNYV